MIKPNEIRIGNYINLVDAEIYPVTVTVINDMTSTPTVNGISVEECDPISITPEWLESLGFEDFHGLWAYSTEQISIEVRFDSMNTPVIGIGTGSAHIMKHFRYVHQLQNIIYTLTGEELKIKEKDEQG